MVDNIKRQPQTFYDHVRELRRRILVSAVAFLLGGGLGYAFHKSLITFLQTPLHEKIYYTSPTGAFNVVMKVSLIVAVCLLIPVLTYNVVGFIQPALENRLKKSQVRKLIGLSLVLALSGASFAFLIVVPMSLHFFAGFNIADVQSLISANEYLNYVTNIIITFIVIFQIPLLILFIDRIKPLSPKMFWKYERHVIVGSLIIAIVLPFTYDPLSQFLIAIPIVVLYNLSMVLVTYSHRTKFVKKSRKVVIAKEVVVSPSSNPPEPLPELSATIASGSRKSPKSASLIDDVRTVPSTKLPQQGLKPKSINFLDLRPPMLDTE